MQLYYTPGACSLTPHIVAREAGIDIKLEKVDLKAKTLASGGDYRAVNPKGQVPALKLDSGDVLTEGPAIVQYIADRNPASGLMPPAGSLDRYRAQEWLNHITSELHKGFGPLFSADTPDAYKTIALAKLGERFAALDKHLAGKQYLMGDKFTAADAYLFTVANWHKFVGLDLSAYANLQAYIGRVAARPKVQEALRAEGLLK